MQARLSTRQLVWLAAIVLLPGVAGPGAAVAALAALTSIGADRGHHVSIQQDAGHDDVVLCHDAHGEAAASGPAIAASDCADDHRFHAMDVESLVSRHDGAKLLPDALLALAAAPPVAIAAPAAESLPAPVPATLVASRHHRTVVLRI
jgi:hypothetical protein